MFKPTKTIILIILLSFLVVSYSLGVENKSTVSTSSTGITLDGMKFTGTITAKGTSKNGSEGLVFQKGKMFSTTFMNFGFSTTAYTLKKGKDGAEVLTCEMTSNKSEMGKLQWDGEVKGNTLTATVQWTKKDGKKIEYTVKAEKK